MVGHLRLVDNFAVACALTRGRAHSFGLLQLCRRSAALLIANNSECDMRWIPSEHNPADAPSRVFEGTSRELHELYAPIRSGGAGPSSRRAVDHLQ
eukprot:4045495-Heterocapsa_arctica.AAC.1